MESGRGGDPILRERDALLADLALLDAQELPSLAALATIAASLCGFEVGSVTLVQDHRQYSVGLSGTSIRESPPAFCSIAAQTPDRPLIVSDALLDARFAAHPVSSQIRAYVGIPLVTADGVVLGTLCVADSEPKTVSDGQVASLAHLATVAVDLLEARLTANHLGAARAEVQEVRLGESRALEQFDAVFDLAPLGMILVDSAGVLVRVNAAFARMLGTTVAALEGSQAWDSTFSDDLPAELDRMTELREGTADVVWREKRYMHVDGTPVPALVSTSIVRSAADGAFVTLSTAESIVERRAAETRMLELQSAVDGIVSLDDRGRVTSWNLGAERLFGHRAPEMLGMTLDAIMPAALRPRHAAGLERLRSQGVPKLLGQTIELPAVRADGQALLVELTLASWTDKARVGYTGILRDITARRQADVRIALVAHAARSANDAETFAQAAEAVLTDVCTKMGWMAARAWTMAPGPALWWVGPHQHEPAMPCPLAELAEAGARHPRNFETYAGRTRVGSREELLGGDMVSAVTCCGLEWGLAVPIMGLGGVAGGLAFYLPEGSEAPSAELVESLEQVGVLLGRVTEREAAATRLHDQARHDSLTGLANRRQILQEISAVQGALASGAVSGGAALLLLDLDRFKVVNDSLGHGAGDVVLQEVARRLQAVALPTETLGRLGGDEFILLLPGSATNGFDGGDSDALLERAQQLLDTLETPIDVVGHTFPLRACVGAVVIGPEHAANGLPAGLLRDADAALMRAKKRGKNRIELFTADLRRDAETRLDDEYALGTAIANNELCLHYQPVIDLHTGAPVGAEALVRWPRAGHGLVPPDRFIPMAEESGLIVELGRWVLRTACCDAASWAVIVPQLAGVPVNVNVSARQLSHPRFLHDVDDALRLSRLPAHRLVLEITESVLVEDDNVISVLHELRDRGIRLALDDFGTGYSSLNYVQRLPVDIIKIDKSFVDLITGPGEGTALTEVVLKLAEAMGLATTAEGVETRDQARALALLGCRSGQGWTWSPAVPLAELGDALDQLVASTPGPIG